MICFKVLCTALTLTFAVSASLAQSTFVTNLASVNQVIPDGQFTRVMDTHLDNPNFTNLTDLGVNITVSSGSNGDLHFYRSAPFSLNGAPDGRGAGHFSVTETTSPRSLLGSFSGTDPNSSWTLILADVDFGQPSTLVQWGLVVSAVPEPASFGLIGVGALIVGSTLYRRRK